MKNLIKVFVLLLGYMVLYFLLDYYYNKNLSKGDTIYVWGDRSTVQLLNLENFEKICGKYTLGAIKETSSVFDFLVFADKVPENARVVILLAKTKPVYANKCGTGEATLSYFPIKQLFVNEYPVSEAMVLILSHLWPQRIFTRLGAFHDKESEAGHSVVSNELWPTQKRIFLNGIGKLMDKNCRISFVETDLRREECVTDEFESESFKYQILNMFSHYCIDSIKVSHSKKDKITVKDGVGVIVPDDSFSRKLVVKISIQQYPTLYVMY